MTSSMHRHARRHAALSLPHQHRVYAGDMAVRRGVIERVIGQAHGVTKKLLMVHAVIIGRQGGCGHSYFPMAVNAFIFAVFSLSTPHNKVER